MSSKMNNRKAPMNFYLLQKPGTKGTRPSDYFVNSLHFPGKYRDIHIHAIEVLPNEPSAEEVFERVIEYLNGTTCNQMHIDDLKSKRDEILKGIK